MTSFRKFGLTLPALIMLVGLQLGFTNVPGERADVNAISIDQVLNYRFPSSLKAAENSDRIAWVTNYKGAYNIWIADGPEFKARQLTDFKVDDGREIRLWNFINNDTALVFTKAGYFNPNQNPDRDGKHSLYSITCNNSKLLKIAENYNVAICNKTNHMAYAKGGELFIAAAIKEPTFKKTATARGTLSQLQWSPDGSMIAMVSTRGSFPYQYSYIMVYHLRKHVLFYVDASIYNDSQPRWSPDGGRLAFRRSLTHGRKGIITARKYPIPDAWEFRVAHVAPPEKDGPAVKAKRLWKSPAEDSYSYARIEWLSNLHICFLSEADGWRHLYTVPANGGKARQLTRGKFIVEQFQVDSHLEKIFFNSNANDINRRHLWSVGTAGKMKALTKGKGIQWSPLLTGNKKYLVYLASDAVTPAGVYVQPLESGKIIPVTPPLKSFPSRQLTIPQAVKFKASDGWKIHSQLFLPPKTYKGKRPAIMFFHGGPIRQMLLGFHYSGYYHRTYAMNQYLASRGYVVLAVNFRLGIGYGRAFRRVSDGGPRGCSEYRDVLAAAAWLRNRPDVDQKRIGVWGGSYGGLLTALCLARNSDLFAAGVDFHGVHDWNQWQAWIDNRQNDHNRTAWKSSPIADIKNWRSPVLLIHADNDSNVPFSETIWLADKLAEQGVPYELLVFPDDVHSFLLYRNWLNAFKATASFFDRKL